MRGPSPIGEMDVSGQRWNKDHTLWIPDLGKERRIEIEKIREELDLDEQARTHGRMDQPASSDQSLNEPQLEICNRIFSGILMLNQFLAEQLGTALAGGRQSLPSLIDEKNYKARIGIAMNEVFAERSGYIQQLRQSDLTLHKDLRYFRNKNKLERQAHYKDLIILVLGVISAMLVLESMANGFLLGDVLSGGPAAGALIALTISMLNIALGVSAGMYGWRNLGHIEWRRRVLGGFVMIVCHGGAIVWNLAIAQFRDVAEKAAADPNYDFNFAGLTAQTVSHIKENGLYNFDSILAWALLCLGLFIHFIAAKEGWDDFADRYPDYKKFDKRARTARQDFETALVDLRAAARDKAKEVVAEAEREELRSKGQALTIANLIGLARQREKEVRDSEDEWVAGGTQLLKIYRDINVEVRGDDSEPPAYFETFPNSADYRNRHYGLAGEKSTTVDRYLAETDASLKEISALKIAADELVETNADTIRELNAEINVALAALDKRVSSVKAEATKEAKAAMRDAEIENS